MRLSKCVLPAASVSWLLEERQEGLTDSRIAEQAHGLGTAVVSGSRASARTYQRADTATRRTIAETSVSLRAGSRAKRGRNRHPTAILGLLKTIPDSDWRTTTTAGTLTVRTMLGATRHPQQDQDGITATSLPANHVYSWLEAELCDYPHVIRGCVEPGPKY